MEETTVNLFKIVQGAMLKKIEKTDWKGAEQKYRKV